jgi:hypothetical protein
MVAVAVVAGAAALPRNRADDASACMWSAMAWEDGHRFGGVGSNPDRLMERRVFARLTTI